MIGEGLVDGVARSERVCNDLILDGRKEAKKEIAQDVENDGLNRWGLL